MIPRIDGGIRMPSVPPAMMEPSAIWGSYLRFSMAGRAMMPMVTTAAPITPTIAASTVDAMTVAAARPPRRPPSHL